MHSCMHICMPTCSHNQVMAAAVLEAMEGLLSQVDMASGMEALMGTHLEATTQYVGPISTP